MKLHFFASKKPRAQKALEELKSAYKHCDEEKADCIVALGGDGSMLRALHKIQDRKLPIFGMNLGTLGFLMNEYKVENLIKRIKSAESFKIKPLQMHGVDKNGDEFKELAYNEVSLLRETHNSAKIEIRVNETTRLQEVVCDGIIVSTPLGSTAYNSSAGGPIIPLNANVLPLTPISAFRPRRWPGALLSNSDQVHFKIRKALERPVSATADSHEIRNIAEVYVSEAQRMSRTLLFDAETPLKERVFREQFPN